MDYIRCKLFTTASQITSRCRVAARRRLFCFRVVRLRRACASPALQDQVFQLCSCRGGAAVCPEKLLATLKIKSHFGDCSHVMKTIRWILLYCFCFSCVALLTAAADGNFQPRRRRYLGKETPNLAPKACTTHSRRKRSIQDPLPSYPKRRSLSPNGSQRPASDPGLGTGLYFSGLEGGVLELKGSRPLPTDSFSVELWVKPEGGQPNPVHIISRYQVGDEYR